VLSSIVISWRPNEAGTTDPEMPPPKAAATVEVAVLPRPGPPTVLSTKSIVSFPKPKVVPASPPPKANPPAAGEGRPEVTVFSVIVFRATVIRASLSAGSSSGKSVMVSTEMPPPAENVSLKSESMSRFRASLAVTTLSAMVTSDLPPTQPEPGSNPSPSTNRPPPSPAPKLVKSSARLLRMTEFRTAAVTSESPTVGARRSLAQPQTRVLTATPPPSSPSFS